MHYEEAVPVTNRITIGELKSVKKHMEQSLNSILRAFEFLSGVTVDYVTLQDSGVVGEGKVFRTEIKL